MTSVITPCAIRLTLNGKEFYFVWDGHHTLQTCRFNGYETFMINYTDVDQIPDEKILPKEYIIAFLKSKLGQLELSKGIFGSVIEEISPKSISEINLLVPKDKKILNKIVNEIKESEKSRNLSMQTNLKAMNEIESFFSN